MSNTYISTALRQKVVLRAKRRCEYCLLAVEHAYLTFEVDHVIAEKHGGKTILKNLAWTCFDCNRFKGSDIASLDPITRKVIPLFNPRTQKWSDHFQALNGRILPLTPEGRVTVNLLKLNLTKRVEVRALLTLAGCYP